MLRELTGVMVRHRVSGVMHLAGLKSPPASAAEPLLYYRENVGGMITLLQALRDADVRKAVFSSSAAVYGAPAGPLVTELTQASRPARMGTRSSPANSSCAIAAMRMGCRGLRFATVGS